MAGLRETTDREKHEMRARLRNVRDAKGQVDRAEELLRSRIVEAVAAGNSQATVGEAAGLSQGRVSQILKEEARS